MSYVSRNAMSRAYNSIASESNEHPYASAVRINKSRMSQMRQNSQLSRNEVKSVRANSYRSIPNKQFSKVLVRHPSVKVRASMIEREHEVSDHSIERLSTFNEALKKQILSVISALEGKISRALQRKQVVADPSLPLIKGKV